MTKRYPGEVHFLPPEARSDGDPETRRHVLLAPCEDHDELATFAFASTSATEASFGASHHLVVPNMRGYNGTGFKQPSYVYGSRLVSTTPAEILDIAGRLIDDMPAVREAIKAGLGIGSGTQRGGGPALDSHRGAVIRLGQNLRNETDVQYGVVVSEPGYSLEERYQNIVPVLDAQLYSAGSEDWEIEAHNAPWLATLDESPKSVLIAPRWVFAAFQPTELDSFTGGVVGLRTINRLDAAFTRIFSLP